VILDRDNVQTPTNQISLAQNIKWETVLPIVIISSDTCTWTWLVKRFSPV